MNNDLKDFEQISYNPFEANTTFVDKSNPDLNYFNDINFRNYETPYVFSE